VDGVVGGECLGAGARVVRTCSLARFGVREGNESKISSAEQSKEKERTVERKKSCRLEHESTESVFYHLSTQIYVF
jgi:hypothetical protein